MRPPAHKGTQDGKRQQAHRDPSHDREGEQPQHGEHDENGEDDGQHNCGERTAGRAAEIRAYDNARAGPAGRRLRGSSAFDPAPFLRSAIPVGHG